MLTILRDGVMRWLRHSWRLTACCWHDIVYPGKSALMRHVVSRASQQTAVAQGPMVMVAQCSVLNKDTTPLYGDSPVVLLSPLKRHAMNQREHPCVFKVPPRIPDPTVHPTQASSSG